MFIATKKVRPLIAYALSLLLLVPSCTGTDFSGSSGKGKKNAAAKTTPDGKDDPANKKADIIVPVGGSKGLRTLPGVKMDTVKSFKSKDPSIATVDEDGTVHGVKEGTTTIEITHKDGSKTIVTVKVTDQDKEPQLDVGKINPELDDGGDPGTSDDTANTPIRIFDDEFRGALESRPLAPDSRVEVWAVTRPGNAYWFRLEGDAVAESKSWTGVTSDDAGGSRTYVTEKGLVVARTGGFLYWIDPAATPEGELPKTAPNYYRLPNVAGNERVCIVSYRKNKKRYVGMGWGKGNFVEFPMDDAPPHVPQWGTVTGTATVPNITWGYSCYIDQTRLIYYGQWVNGSEGGVGAVDLNTMDPVDPAVVAPNAGFASTNLADATLATKGGGSYAMNGDLAGNVYNGKGFYTMAHDRGSRTVWGAAGGVLNIIPDSCLTENANCTTNASFALAALNANVGPMSALGDGRVIGMFRNDLGRVYLLKLRNKKDPSQGLDVTPIADLQGDPYMYTDFTGATLYLTKSDTTFEFEKSKGFDPAEANIAMGLTWQARSGKGVAWKDIKIEVRCYVAGGDKGSFEELTEIKPSLEQNLIKSGSCAGSRYDRVDVRLTQLNDGDTLMDVARVQVTVYQ